MHHPSAHERDGRGPTRALSTRATPLRLTLAGVALLAVIALLAGLAWALTLALAPRPGPLVIDRSPLLAQPAPDFELATLDGRIVRLDEYRGRPVVVNFWASWCVPCRQEFPLLREARDRYASAGLEVLGVVHDDGPEAARAFAAAHGADWPLLLDPDDSTWHAYGGVLLPITFYVDRAGVVRAVSYGPPPSGVLEEQLAKIL